MTGVSDKNIAVIIPARNEAERIGACLSALSGQGTHRVVVVLVVNNTNDTTVEVARHIGARTGLHLEIIDCVLPPDHGVGLARRMGCDHALRRMPDLRYLLTTDADCIVATDWIAGNIAHLKTVDAVCGKVDPIAAEAGILDGMDRTLATQEGIYRSLVQELYARRANECAYIRDTHGEAAGASLAFRKDAYLAVGGFYPVRCGEDRQIVRALRRAGKQVRHPNDVVVHASCRLQGRAAGGMSDALNARISGTDYLIDDCLPPAEWLVSNADAGTLGVWPPQVALSDRVHVQHLPQHIERLQQFLNSGQRAQTPSAPAALREAELMSHRSMFLLDRGSTVAADPDPRSLSMPNVSAPATVQTLPETPANAEFERSMK